MDYLNRGEGRELLFQFLVIESLPVIRMWGRTAWYEESQASSPTPSNDSWGKIFTELSVRLLKRVCIDCQKGRSKK